MCKVEDCERMSQARGYCSAHYKRVLKHGDPLAHIPIREVAPEMDIYITDIDTCRYQRGFAT